ncbi:MAG: CRISPR-associated RAMP protein Csx7 [Hominimerdicola sp.]
MLFDKFVNEIIITGKIIAIDPMHIGSSETTSLDPTAEDSPVLKDSRGLPVIPGSSLKGILRSRFETVLNSLGKNNVCLLDKELMHENCVDSKRDDELKNKYKNPQEYSQQVYENSCEACKLFGGTAIAGRIQIKDCYCCQDKVIYEHRDGVRIDRKTGSAAAKFDYEIVPKDTTFDFYMKAENLDEKQKKYLNFLVKELESGNLSVGGKNTRGLGRIKLIIDEKCYDENHNLKVKTAEDLKKELGF